MLTQHLLRVITASVLFVCASESTTGQTTGRLTGVAKDSSGGVIARAEVQAVNEATGEKWKAVADEAGNYSFLLLPPGLYEIEVSAGGFKTAVSIRRLSYKRMGHSLDARWALGPQRISP